MLFSCSEVIDIDVEEEDKVLVLNGMLSPDSLIKINLGKSMGILDGDNSFEFIYNAEVKLYEDDEFIQNMPIDTFGYYISSIYPKMNSKYKIIVTSGDFPQIEAETTIPKIVPISEMTSDFTMDSVTEQWWNPQTQEYFDTTFISMSEEGYINITFDDPANETNFYFVTLSALLPIYEYSEFGGEYVRVGEKMTSISYEVNTISYNNYFYMNNFTGYIIADELFNGQSYTLNAKIYSWNFGGYYGQNSMPLSPIYVHLHSVPEELFNFITSYNKYEEASYNPFAEPVNIFSNIKNGYGFFMGYNTATDSIAIN